MSGQRAHEGELGGADMFFPVLGASYMGVFIYENSLSYKPIIWALFCMCLIFLNIKQF